MGQVKLILREDVHGLGAPGDLVAVKPGYARNYLIPQGKAILATESSVAELEHHRRVVAEKVAQDLTQLESLRDRLEALELEVEAKVGEEGKLFGSVTAARIAELIGEKGLDLDRRSIQLHEPIKEAGEHQVTVRLKQDLQAQIKLTVRPEE